MPGIEDLEKSIARLETANEDTRAVVREAHEAIQTMRQLLKDLHEVRESCSQGVKKEVDEALERQVKMGLEEYQTTIETATHEAHQHVIDEFDKLHNIMLYGNPKGKGMNLVTEW